MLRGRSMTVLSNAARNSSCNWKNAEPSVSTGLFIGASADKIESRSFALIIARSIKRPSILLGLSIASVRPRPGSRSMANAPVPKWTSRSRSPVECPCARENIHARDAAIVDAPDPPRVPMTAVEIWGRSVLLSSCFGAFSIDCALAKASRSASALSGLSR